MSAAIDDGRRVADGKFWSTLVAKACLRGFQLWRTDPADGEQRFFARRWGIVRVLADVAEVEAWLDGKA